MFACLCIRVKVGRLCLCWQELICSPEIWKASWLVHHRCSIFRFLRWQPFPLWEYSLPAMNVSVWAVSLPLRGKNIWAILFEALKKVIQFQIVLREAAARSACSVSGYTTFWTTKNEAERSCIRSHFLVSRLMFIIRQSHEFSVAAHSSWSMSFISPCELVCWLVHLTVLALTTAVSVLSCHVCEFWAFFFFLSAVCSGLISDQWVTTVAAFTHSITINGQQCTTQITVRLQALLWLTFSSPCHFAPPSHLYSFFCFICHPSPQRSA